LRHEGVVEVFSRSLPELRFYCCANALVASLREETVRPGENSDIEAYGAIGNLPSCLATRCAIASDDDPLNFGKARVEALEGISGVGVGAVKCS
jgi:hypothetical protein